MNCRETLDSVLRFLKIKWPAQKIVQSLCHLRDTQKMLDGTLAIPKSRFPHYRKEKVRYERLLRIQIWIWGGLRRINEWLEKYDSASAISGTREIAEMDWRWLPEKYRL